jgi:hypothetical protein
MSLRSFSKLVDNKDQRENLNNLSRYGIFATTQHMALVCVHSKGIVVVLAQGWWCFLSFVSPRNKTTMICLPSNLCPG